LDVHHVPTFKVNVAGLPVFAFLIAVENETTLACPNEDHYLFAHEYLLSIEAENMF